MDLNSKFELGLQIYLLKYLRNDYLTRCYLEISSHHLI